MYVMPGDRAGRKRNPFVYFASSRNNKAPNSAQPVYAWRVTDPSYANGHAAFIPKGTGGIHGSISDGTITGGNARGNYSIDLQLAPRTAANQVAGLIGSVIVGGRRGSIRNTGAGTSDYSALVGGDGNYIDSSSGSAGVASFIGGGVAVTFDQSGGAGARASIGGNNIAFITDCSGAANLGGANISMAAQYGINLAARQGVIAASMDNAVITGLFVRARTTNSFNFSAGNPGASIGRSQGSLYPIGVDTSGVTPAELTTNTSSATLFNRPLGVFAANEAASFYGMVTVKDNASGSSGTWKFECSVGYVAGVLTLNFGGGAATNLFLSAALAGVTLVIGVDTVNKQVTFTATGLVGLALHWQGFVIASHTT